MKFPKNYRPPYSYKQKSEIKKEINDTNIFYRHIGIILIIIGLISMVILLYENKVFEPEKIKISQYQDDRLKEVESKKPLNIIVEESGKKYQYTYNKTSKSYDKKVIV